MQYWTQPIRISIPKEKMDLAKEFAKAVVSTTNYRDSNQRNSIKIENDHFVSKLGEEAAYQAFKKFTNAVTEPDYTIYVGDYKSWDSDLEVDEKTVAIKTQTSSASNRYGLSWTFQCSSKRKDPILSKPDAWICFVECDDMNDFECKVFPLKQLKELQFDEPKLPHLKGNKKVVYADVNKFI